MNTRQLHHFLALLSERSLSAAAEAVNLSQPALSRSIRSLEDGLGVPLFDRNDRRLKPTAFAIAYEERARRIVYEETEGARAMASMQAGEAGTLTIGMGSSLTDLVLNPLLLRLLQESPHLKLRPMIATSDRLMQALMDETLDFFIGDVRVGAHIREINIEHLYACTFGWYARTGHPLALRTCIGIDALKAYPLVAAGYIDQSLARRFMDIYGMFAPIEDHFAVVSHDVGTVQTLLTSTDAIAPATDLSVVALMRTGTIVKLDVAPPLDLDMSLGILHRTGRTMIPVAQRAFAMIRESFKAMKDEIEQCSGSRPSDMRKKL